VVTRSRPKFPGPDHELITQDEVVDELVCGLDELRVTDPHGGDRAFGGRAVTGEGGQWQRTRDRTCKPRPVLVTPLTGFPGRFRLRPTERRWFQLRLRIFKVACGHCRHPGGHGRVNAIC
jgi:hypothetical protein